MEHLPLNELIEIYLGNSLYKGLETSVSKGLAYKEIQKRTVDYRYKNNISDLVSNLYEYHNFLPEIEKANLVLFIDNAYGREVFELSENIKLYSFKKYQPELFDLLKKINDINDKLDNIWENDPEHIRYGIKFLDRSNLRHSQEYYKNHKLDNVFFSSTKIWKYQISATLGFDNMTSIVEQSKISDIVFLPISIKDWSFSREIIFNFITTFYATNPINSFLWILFFDKTQSRNTIVDDILYEIVIFTRKLFNTPGSHFDLMPYSIIEQIAGGDFDLNGLTEKLDTIENLHK